MDDHKLWYLMNESWNSLAAHFQPAVDELVKGSDLDRHTWSVLLAVLTSEPEAVSTADLMVRNPYADPETFTKRLEEAVRLGFLQEANAGYRLSETGRRGTWRLIDAARFAMTQADPLPASDSQRLAEFFERLVQSCLEAPPPPEPWSILSSYKLMPPSNPPLPFIEQAYTCLSAYHDDSHLAAWQFSSLTATALETLTLLWRGEARSLDEICAELADRGHPCEVYARSLDELRERNYIGGPDSNLLVTADGRIFRNQVDADTDRFFFAPWGCLSHREKTEMGGLLIRLRDGLMRENA